MNKHSFPIVRTSHVTATCLSDKVMKNEKVGNESVKYQADQAAIVFKSANQSCVTIIGFDKILMKNDRYGTKI